MATLHLPIPALQRRETSEYCVTVATTPSTTAHVPVLTVDSTVYRGVSALNPSDKAIAAISSLAVAPMAMTYLVHPKTAHVVAVQEQPNEWKQAARVVLPLSRRFQDAIIAGFQSDWLATWVESKWCPILRDVVRQPSAWRFALDRLFGRALAETDLRLAELALFLNRTWFAQQPRTANEDDDEVNTYETVLIGLQDRKRHALFEAAVCKSGLRDKMDGADRCPRCMGDDAACDKCLARHHMRRQRQTGALRMQKQWPNFVRLGQQYRSEIHRPTQLFVESVDRYAHVQLPPPPPTVLSLSESFTSLYDLGHSPNETVPPPLFRSASMPNFP